uniref:MFS transporter n=1 Tax=Cyberlindnera americana TaxID=36016 RepID=A0A5P8N8F0_9ASCO|nr:MFS transporter [Cyberlindnera americana]
MASIELIPEAVIEETLLAQDKMDPESPKYGDINIEKSREDLKPPYTVYSRTEKYILVLLAASICCWSTIGSPIYYPALGTIEKEFNISEELVNISVVVYLLCQGIFPTFAAGAADIYGRRPVVILCLCIFIGASIGIAVISSYTVLLILRCIQSAGASPTVSIATGIVGDYTQRHERGGYIGIQSGISLLGQAFGPLIGAGLVAGFNWRSIFWFLAIGGGVSLIMAILILPETKRSFVGNGSVKPKYAANIAPIVLIPYFRKKWKLDNPDYSTLDPDNSRDIFASFKILIVPEVAICLMNGAVHFATWVVSLTCLTTELSKLYGYDVMTIGLCYISAGVGGLSGAIVSGRVLDRVYRHLHGRFLQQKQDGVIAQDAEFNIVKARVVVVFPFVLVAEGFTIMYGWCLYKHVHISAICISTFFVSFGCLSVVGSNMTLMIDLYPSQSSAATSCVNLTRCLTAALLVGTLTYMNNAMTVAGTLTMLAGFGAVFAISLLIPVKYAAQWRASREKRKALND